MSARLILLIHTIADWITGLNDERHLTTDPACIHYRAPRPGSRLDRASRGVSCVPCMVYAATGGERCSLIRLTPDSWTGDVIIDPSIYEDGR